MEYIQPESMDAKAQMYARMINVNVLIPFHLQNVLRVWDTDRTESIEHVRRVFTDKCGHLGGDTQTSDHILLSGL